jgi:hypothetical protein
MLSFILDHCAQEGGRVRIRRWLAALMFASLASCGGSVSVGIDVTDGDLHFIIWTGNFYGNRILDADSQEFAFYVGSGCLYNFQTGRRNSSFCIVAGGNIIQYEGVRLRIANIRSTNGQCVSALVDDTMTRFINLEVDGTGREVVFITALVPVLCTI